MGDKSPQEQTNEEWLQDYDAGSVRFDKRCRLPVHEHISMINKTSLSIVNKANLDATSDMWNEKTLTGIFTYREHRTTRQSRLVMEFMHAESQTLVAMFFNVQVENQRTGKKYPVGRGRQFLCKKNSKFRRLWESMFDKEPYRWSRAHHGLSKLRNMALEGEAVLKQKKDGMGTYWEMTKLKLCEWL